MADIPTEQHALITDRHLSRGYHLWRIYPTGERKRYACTVEKDVDVPSGYRIVDYDDSVADTSFLSRLDRHMRAPVLSGTSWETSSGIYDSMYMVGPEHENHFGEALRSLPDAAIGPRRRSR